MLLDQVPGEASEADRDKSGTVGDVLVALQREYPSYETDLSIWTTIQNLAILPNNPKAACISEPLAVLDHWVARLTPRSYGGDELLFWLVAKISPHRWDECRGTAERKARTLTHGDLSVLLLELLLEKEGDQHLNAYRPRGGNSGNHLRGYPGPRAGQGITSKNARYMSNVQEVFWCDARDEKGGLVQIPDCNQHNCLVVQGKKQETNSGGRAKMPNHCRCTITCALSGKQKHYEDECYHKQCLSAKLRNEAQNGGQGGRGEGNGDGNKVKGKPKGRGKGQEQGKGGGRGGPDK